jgi:hypothetical protein
MRWLVRSVALVIVAAVAGLGTVALTSRNDLERANDDLDAAWERVRPDLDARYDALGRANEAVRGAGGSARRIVGEIDSTLARWTDAANTRAPVATQIGLANELEGLGRRLAATIRDSPRFETDSVATAYADFERAAVDARDLNRAVDHHDLARGGTLRRFVTGMLGNGDVPHFAA